MTTTLQQTPLYEWHQSRGARMVEFGGWSMPVLYTSIVAEHQATRGAASLFDISHMGRLRFEGPAALALVDSLVTRDIAGLAPGRVAYGLVTNEHGGILDDVLVYHLQDAAGASYYLMVVNASNREKIIRWIEAEAGAAPGTTWIDATMLWAMIAVQGPRAEELVQGIVTADLAPMPYYAATETRIAGGAGIVSRTGYTGEDGFELIVGQAAARDVWEQLLDRGQAWGVVPAGLGCRDTLRLEAGMPLYGHELNEDVDPYQAGLGFAVNLDGAIFAGHDVLSERRHDKSRPRRVGLALSGKRSPREGYAILHDDRKVGHVTSGTFSPTLERPIAMGYVEPAVAKPGTQVAVDIRGRVEPAEIVKLPFYRRPKGSAP